MSGVHGRTTKSYNILSDVGEINDFWMLVKAKLRTWGKEQGESMECSNRVRRLTISNALLSAISGWLLVHGVPSKAQTINDMLVPAKQSGRAAETASEEKPPTSKKEFLEKARTDSQWWQTWGKTHYNNLHQGLLQRSGIIAGILQKDYNVTVPYDPTRPGYVPDAVFLEPDRRIAGNWCANVVAIQLGRTLAAVTWIVNPAQTYPERSDQFRRRSGPEYLQYSFKLLHNYCGDEPFISAFQNFLEEYRQVISERKLAEDQADRQAAEALAAAKKKELDDWVAANEKKKRDAEEAFAAQKREEVAKHEADKRRILAIREAEQKQRHQEMAKARMVADEKQQAIWAKEAQALELQRLERLTYKENLKSGKLPVKTIKDAVIFYEPTPGQGLAFRPMVNPDAKIYKIVGFLRPGDGGNMLFEIPNNGPERFYFLGRQTSQTKLHPGYDLRYNTIAVVIGKYVKNVDYRTLGGEHKTAPLLDIVMLGPDE